MSNDKKYPVQPVPGDHADTALEASAATAHPHIDTRGAPSQGRRRAAQHFVRIAYLAVFVINVMCALQFVIDPQAYLGAYELREAGTAGAVAIRGIGVAFLMWNCTYPPVIASPRRFRALATVVLVQQAVGLVGESLILASLGAGPGMWLPAGHELLAASILRFIAFDAGGFVLMLAAFVAYYVRT